jgi:quercetin dioxygenase-like cupin family protein
MKSSKLTIAATVAIVALVGTWGMELRAQQPGFTRTMLQKGDVSAPGQEAVQVRAEFTPGAAAGKHTHPGQELGYILEGTLLLEVDGKPPVTLNAGDYFFVPAGIIHDGKNIGTGNAKVLATYVVEKGKPLATPVK